MVSAMSRPLALAVVVTALSFVTAACPPASLIGQPCADPGDSPCEGDKLLRCDGKFYVELAPCASQCIAAKEPIVHGAGSITADETWACVDGPHLVNGGGAVVVSAGATLTIEPGAMVRLDPATSIQTDTESRIISVGDQNAPILVTSNNGEKPGYGNSGVGGLNVFALDPADEPSRVEHTIIERGTHGLGVFGLDDETTPPTVKNSTFRDNNGFGMLILCNQADFVVPPEYTEDNEFFTNGSGDPGGDISECNPL